MLFMELRFSAQTSELKFGVKNYSRAWRGSLPRQVSMDKKTYNIIEQGFRKGTLKTSRANVERIMTRAMDGSGKVYTGEAGKALRKQQLAKQAYYDRNR